jgi:hypothetical protein
MPEIPLDISKAHAAGVALTADEVSFLVEMAGRAPSVHNTRPWQFRVQDSGLDLYADQARRAEQPTHGIAAAACAGPGPGQAFPVRRRC